MLRGTVGWGIGVLVASALAYACGFASNDAAFGDEPSGAGSNDSGADGGATGSEPPISNGVILVHAAKKPAFRLCFENEGDRLPQPDSDVMPNSNAVGVDVGSAVRIGPLRGAPGKVYLFDEVLIRQSYAPFGGDGPTCGELLETALKDIAVPLGEVATDLSRGVHLLVVSGCPANSALRTYTEAECGKGYNGTTGNLAVQQIELKGAGRTPRTLPVQAVNLSAPFDVARTGKAVSLRYGVLADGGATTVVAKDLPLDGEPVPSTPASLTFDTTTSNTFDTTGFRLSIEEDGGASSVLEASLATVQNLSAPQDIPSVYYATASNYVLLLLGDPAPKLGDGGPDPDERSALHFLAVPVVEPLADAGADAGPSDAASP